MMVTKKARKKYRHYKKFVKINFNENFFKVRRHAPLFWVYDIVNQNWRMLLDKRNLNPQTFSRHDYLIRYLLVDNLAFLLQNPVAWHDSFLPQIKKFMLAKNIPLFRVNYETILTKNERVSEVDRERYFSFHRYYQLVGSAFAAPFRGPKKFLFYKYGYLLSMFLVLSIFVNIDHTLSTPIPFIVKIMGYKTAIYTLQLIDAKDFNLAIIMTNKKMKNINWKEVKPWRRI